MTEEIIRDEDENEDLICPITCEPIFDPVITNDGHVYEREAIIKWIFEHGTNPLTRRPLTIHDLKPVDHTKTLAKKKPKSIACYDAYNSEVIFQPVRQTVVNNLDLTHGTVDAIPVNRRIRNCSNKTVTLVILSSFIFPVILILGIVIGLRLFYDPGIGNFTPINLIVKIIMSTSRMNSLYETLKESRYSVFIQ